MTNKELMSLALTWAGMSDEARDMVERIADGIRAVGSTVPKSKVKRGPKAKVVAVADAEPKVKRKYTKRVKPEVESAAPIEALEPEAASD